MFNGILPLLKKYGVFVCGLLMFIYHAYLLVFSPLLNRVEPVEIDDAYVSVIGVSPFGEKVFGVREAVAYYHQRDEQDQLKRKLYNKTVTNNYYMYTWLSSGFFWLEKNGQAMAMQFLGPILMLLALVLFGLNLVSIQQTGVAIGFSTLLHFENSTWLQIYTPFIYAVIFSLLAVAFFHARRTGALKSGIGLMFGIVSCLMHPLGGIALILSAAVVVRLRDARAGNMFSYTLFFLGFVSIALNYAIYGSRVGHAEISMLEIIFNNFTALQSTIGNSLKIYLLLPMAAYLFLYNRAKINYEWFFISLVILFAALFHFFYGSPGELAERVYSIFTALVIFSFNNASSAPTSR